MGFVLRLDETVPSSTWNCFEGMAVFVGFRVWGSGVAFASSMFLKDSAFEVYGCWRLGYLQ